MDVIVCVLRILWSASVVVAVGRALAADCSQLTQMFLRFISGSWPFQPKTMAQTVLTHLCVGNCASVLTTDVLVFSLNTSLISQRSIRLCLSCCSLIKSGSLPTTLIQTEVSHEHFWWADMKFYTHIPSKKLLLDFCEKPLHLLDWHKIRYGYASLSKRYIRMHWRSSDFPSGAIIRLKLEV